MNNILITGAAGFVGFHLSQKLCKENYNIIGLDNINNYYETSLKYSRLDILKKFDNFSFHKVDLISKETLSGIIKDSKIDYIIHLAAQAGVRYSISNPQAYIDSNIQGFLNVLEVCRNNDIKHLVYASSSSVYGGNTKQPFSESDNVDHPVSLYAATKKSNELMAHTYSELYNIPTTGLRFFTVYGPFGRPDMAYFSFTKKILNNEPIDVFNNGDLERDFTYIDDIVEGISKLIDEIPSRSENWDRLANDPATSFSPYRVFNIGNNKPVKLMNFINVLETIIGKDAQMNFLPMQAGDVYSTFADVDLLNKQVGYNPKTSIEEGLEKFVSWYRNYYKI